MTNEEVKEHIDKKVSEICDKIADLYNELWNTAQIAEGGGYDYDENDSVILREERTRHDIECEDLCQRVKALGSFALVANQTKDNYITVTSAQSPEFGIGVYRRVCGDGTLEK